MAVEAAETTRVRLAVIGVVCISLFASLFVRLYYLQVIDHEDFEVQAQAVHLRTIHEQGPRGRILDRNGKILVDNKISVVIGIDKATARSKDMGNGDANDSDEQVARRKAVFSRLAILLTNRGMPTKVTSIETLYTDKRYSPNDFVPIIDEGVTDELQAYLGERHAQFPGIEAKSRTVRVYPYGTAAAHLLGYVGNIIEEELVSPKVKAEGTPKEPAGPDAKPYAPEDQIGKSGVERTFEPYLRGTPGDTVIQVDAKGQRIGTFKTPKLAQGDDLWLTIDINIQVLTEQRLRDTIAARGPGAICDKTTRCNAREGSAVVLDPTNGEVIAMASYPTFDPSALVNGVSSDQWTQLNSKETGKPMLNRAIAESYAPGSTFKLISSHAALGRGLITPQEVVQDRGVYRLDNCSSGKCEFQNAGRTAHGAVNLQTALTVSSDVYYYRIGDLLWRGKAAFGETPIQDSANVFGFGEKTGIDLPSESRGLIGTPEWLAGVYEAHPENWARGNWGVGDSMNLAIGQGFTAVTPLQLANAYATFANGGTRYKPKIAVRVTRPKDLTKAVVDITNAEVVKVFEPEVNGTVEFPDPNQYASIYTGLQGVANPAAEGTAASAFRDYPVAWQMAGKTGTAQVDGKADTSVFVGWGPATGFVPPQYAMAAVLPEAGFGNEAAAPLVASVLKPVSDNAIPVAVPSVITGLAAQPPPPSVPVVDPAAAVPPPGDPAASTTTGPPR